MNTKTLEEQFSEILIPRDKAADQLIDHLKAEKTLPLVSIHGPSGVGKTDLAGPILTRRLKTITGKSNPKLLRVQISPDDAAIDVALRITDLIIDNHSEFRSRKAAKVFRDKITRSVRRAPTEAAERLRSMMRASEKGKFDIKKIQLVICLDGADKLFENRARCGADLSKVAICGDLNDPVGFLSKLVGMHTILFSMVHRSWVSRDVRAILDRGGIDETRRYDVHLSYPGAEEVEKIVEKALAPVKALCEKKDEIDEYGDLLTDSLRKNPPLIGVLPKAMTRMFADMDGDLTRVDGCVERHLANNGLLGDLVNKADEIYLEQNSNNKLALEEVFSNLIKGDGRLLIKDAVMSEELWVIALKFVDNRILAIDGRTYRNARFIVTHKGLLSTWTRAVGWTGENHSIGITQLRSLDDKALSWQLADRNKALLLSTEETKQNARLVLRDSELSSQLSPLTREYLTRSLKPKKNLKRMMLSKKLWIPVGSIFALLFILAVIVVIIPDPADREKVAQAPDKAVVDETSAPAERVVAEVDAPRFVPKSFLEDLKVEPMAGDLLASAGKISETTDRILDDFPLLTENDLIPVTSTETVTSEQEVDEVFVAPENTEPLLTELELIAHINEITAKDSTKTPMIPLGLPSAQAHFEKGLREINANGETSGENNQAEVVRKVVFDAPKKSSGRVDKKALARLAADDTKRMFEGLTNRRLETGGAELKVPTVNSKSSWREILNSMGSGIAKQDLSLVLDSLRYFHEKTVQYPDEVKNIQVSEFKDLTSHLGKVALVQQDRAAMQGAWKLELVSQNVVELNTGLRMLMARLALNAGRDKEAVAYLAQTEVQSNINSASIDIMKAAIGWHFDEGSKAAESFRKLLPPPQVSAH